MMTSTFIILDTEVIKKYPVLLATDFMGENSLSVNMHRRRISRQYSNGTLWEYYVGFADERCVSTLNYIPCVNSGSTIVLPGESVKLTVRWNFSDCIVVVVG